VALLLLFIPLAMTGLGAFFDKASLVDIYRKTARRKRSGGSCGSDCCLIWFIFRPRSFNRPFSEAGMTGRQGISLPSA
jgi:hypothetical protein